MPQVTIAINNRLYQVGCEAGQEAHITRLAGYIDTKVKELANQAGQVGDARLLLMASILIADELADAYDDLEQVRGMQQQVVADAAKLKQIQAQAALDQARLNQFKASEQGMIEAVIGLAQKVDAAAERLERA